MGDGHTESGRSNALLRRMLPYLTLTELVSRKVNMRGIRGRMLQAYNLAVVVESRWEMQEVLGEWKETFGKHGLKLSMK